MAYRHWIASLMLLADEGVRPSPFLSSPFALSGGGEIVITITMDGNGKDQKEKMAFDKVVQDEGLAARVATEICRALNLQVSLKFTPVFVFAEDRCTTLYCRWGEGLA